MRETALLFGKVLLRPSEALRELFAESRTLAPSLLFFALYTAGAAAAAVFLPRSFMPEAPALAFGRSFTAYLLAGAAGSAVNTLLAAAFLPRLAAVLARGRIGPRVLLGLGGTLAYFAALALLKNYPAALACAALAAAAAAFFAYQGEKSSFPAMLRVLLASFAIGTAILPLEGLAILLSSSRLYELSVLAMALWYFVFLVKALRLAGGPGGPRAAAAVFLAMAASGLFLYNVSLLLPENMQALVMLF
ncbi:MAG TPA: hypothetical protein DCZ92_06335 [Elusimicrobia bacterium]|nr:MAG: hypothetical protein A2016_06350 [Elusimicrobia bacterium GWF2_62_30]HBA60424.1 hypothetical protein [Elusimicrobiota bacterium]